MRNGMTARVPCVWIWSKSVIRQCPTSASWRIQGINLPKGVAPALQNIPPHTCRISGPRLRLGSRSSHRSSTKYKKHGVTSSEGGGSEYAYRWRPYYEGSAMPEKTASHSIESGPPKVLPVSKYARLHRLDRCGNEGMLADDGASSISPKGTSLSERHVVNHRGDRCRFRCRLPGKVIHPGDQSANKKRAGIIGKHAILPKLRLHFYLDWPSDSRAGLDR